MTSPLSLIHISIPVELREDKTNELHGTIRFSVINAGSCSFLWKYLSNQDELLTINPQLEFYTTIPRPLGACRKPTYGNANVHFCSVHMGFFLYGIGFFVYSGFTVFHNCLMRSCILYNFSLKSQPKITLIKLLFVSLWNGLDWMESICIFSVLLENTLHLGFGYAAL